MSEKYKVRDPLQLYFITLTVTGWVDLFIRREYKDILLNSLRYCQEKKGLQVCAWVIMSSHLHLIVSSREGEDLASIIRDFKTFTSKALLREIREINESRREWMLGMFAAEAERTKRGKHFKLWRDGFHPVELSDNTMKQQRMDYLHNNPVEAGFVEEPAQYLYSSAIDYSGGKGLLPVAFV
jgi:putative transposase